MKRICICALAALCAAVAVSARQLIPRSAESYDIGKDFAQASAWQQKGAEFVAAHRRNYFRFLQEGKEDAANAIRQGNVRYFGLEVYETRIWFGEKGVDRIELSLFNKGDASKPLGSSELAEMLQTVRGTLNAEGEKSPAPESANKGEGTLQKSQTWSKRTPAVAQLTWRYKKDRAGVDTDFVRLTLINAAAGAAVVKKELAPGKGAVGRGQVKQNVVRVAGTKAEGKAVDGDVYVANVPMVDQGQKGYCAVATSERVLRYLGQNIDEHELGASAKSTAAGGTSVQAMYESVRTIARKYGIGTYVIYGDMNQGMSDRAEKFLKEIENYNKVAKKLKKPSIERSDFMRGNAVDANAAREKMDGEVIKALKLKSSKYTGFKTAIKKQVQSGLPLFWGVTLGLFPEPDIPQASGGHMRLIIGFNEKTKEIIYTDSWGAGHEYKRMSMDNAWAITDVLFYLRPSRE